MKKAVQLLAINLVVLLVLFCLMEISLLVIVNTRLLLYMPRAAGMSLYNRSRNTIQFLPECAEYDPELTYLLRKRSDFTFENIEFRTRYHTNSLGLRDDEASLESPEIIVLGDSFTMGWGVEQHETFVDLLEKNLGMLTLNAGVSSYGTVREGKLLNRIDTSRMKYLIVQYSENDIMENHAFSTGRYTPTTEKWYRWLQNRRSYYFRKYSFTLFKLVKNNLISLWNNRSALNDSSPTYDAGKYGMDISDAKRTEVDLFLSALRENVVIDHRKTRMIVFELSEPSWYTGEMIRGLRKRVSAGTVIGGKNIRILEVMERLAKEDFFLVDEHINRNGHAKVAAMLIEEIRRME